MTASKSTMAFLLISVALYARLFSDLSIITGDPVSGAQIAGHPVAKTYNLANQGLVSPYVEIIFQDWSGKYWIGTTQGAILYDEKRNFWASFTAKTGKLVADHITMIGESGDNKVWLASYPQTAFFGPGINCYDGENWRKIDASNSPLGRSRDPGYTYPVYAMFQGRNGRLWFTVEDGLLAYDGNSWTSLIELPRAIDERGPVTIRSGLQDSEGQIWLGRGSRGVIRFDEEFKKSIKYNPMVKNVRFEDDELDGFREVAATGVWCIYEDRGGRIWFASGNGYVYVYDKKRDSWSFHNVLTQFEPKPEFRPAMPSLIISAIYQDRAGLMMFATQRGLVTLNESENKWEVLTSRNSALPSDLVSAIMEDRTGQIWLATAARILILRG